MSATLIDQAEALLSLYDVLVIGAGPAGMCAATELATGGLSVLVLDDNAAPGGQIYRAVTQQQSAGREYLGTAYWAGEKIARDFLIARLHYAPRTRVWSLDAAAPQDEERYARVGISLAGVARHVQARRVILATGAMERPMPVPGWTLPGVMTAGAAQIALKSAGMCPQGRVVLAGCGPLLYQLAVQLHDAGAEVVALLDTGRGIRSAWRFLPDFLCSTYAVKGALLLAKTRRSTRVVSGVRYIGVEGGCGAERVRFRTASAEEVLDVDLVLLHQGVIPETSLANSAGCALAWNDAVRAFQPQVDGTGRSSHPDIFIAGDGARIGGALAAAEAGRAVALAVLAELNEPDRNRHEQRQAQVLKGLARWQRGRRFIDAAYLPAPRFLAPEDGATVVCRCEEVTAGTVREAVRLGAIGPNQLKAFTRCGMGPCQGRQCGATVVELMAQAWGVHPFQVGTYRLRPPIKPLRLSEIAALPAGDVENHAVTGLWPEPAEPE
jgi:NADPH-dependent 2,4-dienoyl-CoA reductase/sulfur reductase-like enzyme